MRSSTQCLSFELSLGFHSHLRFNFLHSCIYDKCLCIRQVLTTALDYRNDKRYEGGLKSFRPKKDTTFFQKRFFIFQHSLPVTLHTSPSDAPISVTRPNGTRRFSPQNNCSRR